MSALGSAQRSARLVEITAALAADLAALAQALDAPGADIAATLRQLGADVKAAVTSYLGLTVSAGDADSALSFTTLADLAAPLEVRASMVMPSSALVPAATGPDVNVILYAATPGAFVDLAADLSWLTGLELDEFALDQHLNRAAHAEPGAIGNTASLIDQALGVLIGRGRTPEQARDELDARADEAGVTRSDAARSVLRGVPRPD
jgi:hypothetical protein